MSTFVLTPGAGGSAWIFHRLAPLLRRAGQGAIPVDLPGADPRAGLDVYTALVLDAMKGHDDVVLVAHSLGGFVAPLVCERASVRGLVFVNAMIPKPGETAGAWWEATGSIDARVRAAKKHGYSTEYDEATYFFHDVNAEDVREGAEHQYAEAKIVFGETCDFERWPDVPTLVLVGRDDRFFPCELQEKVARERLGSGTKIETIPGGHLAPLSQAGSLAARLVKFGDRRVH